VFELEIMGFEKKTLDSTVFCFVEYGIVADEIYKKNPKPFLLPFEYAAKNQFLMSKQKSIKPLIKRKISNYLKKLHVFGLLRRGCHC